MAVRLGCLSLCFGNLLYEDAGHRDISCVGIIVSAVSMAFTNPESHADLSFVDVVTVTLNLADTMRVYRFTVHVHDAVNW